MTAAFDDAVDGVELAPAAERPTAGGVAAALAYHLRTDAIVTRVAFLVLSAAGGLGVFIYGAAWLTWRDENQVLPKERLEAAERDRLAPMGVAMVIAGVLIVARSVWFGFSDGLVWPVALVGAGAAFVIPQIDRAHRVAAVGAGWSGITASSQRASAVRAILGLALLVAGVVFFLLVNLSVTAVRDGLFGALVILGGVGLILGPWFWGLGQRLVDERSQRVRSDERAAVAAHLHDSVLQTLALVQRRADDPREVVALARRQERELRAWLYGDSAAEAEGQFKDSLERLIGQVEDRYLLEVESVIVGDCEVDRPVGQVIAAAGEALVNAAKFSGCDQISMYAEVTETGVEVFVRDRGVGFDPDEVPEDRLGIARSIKGRLERAGGTASVHSAPGEGTEVELVLGTPQ